MEVKNSRQTHTKAAAFLSYLRRPGFKLYYGFYYTLGIFSPKIKMLSQQYFFLIQKVQSVFECRMMLLASKGSKCHQSTSIASLYSCDTVSY